MAASPGMSSRKLWPITLLIVGLLLGLQTIRLRLAEKAVRDGNGAVAFSIRPQNGWGAALHAEDMLAAGDVPVAQRTSIAALDSTPYAVIAVRTLARTRERVSGPRAAEPAWQLASALGWRDKPTQFWAVLRALANAEAGIFAMRADALLRSPGDNRTTTSLVRRALTVPAVRQAFIDRLAQRPPWRPPFFDVDQPLQGKELDGTAIALLGLAGTSAEPSRRELADTIAGLISERRYQEALRLDRTFVRRRPDPGSLIDDGGFELENTDYLRGVTPFDWVLSEGTAALDRSHGRRSMSLTSEGSRGFPAVTRYVPIGPGSYTLRYQIQGDRAAPAYLGISVICASSGALLGSSGPAPLQTSGWESRSFQFTVPADCGLAKITLNAAKSDPSVDALMDDIVISRY
jgi:hypothetical protein